MKILFAYRYGNLGGVCAQLVSRLAGFAGRPEDEVHFAFLEDHGLPEQLAAYPRVIIEGAPAKLSAYCRDQKIDLVSVIDTPEVLVPLAKAGGDRQLLLEVHTTYVDRLEYLRDIPEAVGSVVVPSEYAQKLVRRQLRTPLPVHVVRNCVDAELFRLREVEAPLRPVCLWVGKLDDHKNWRGFVDIASELAARRPKLDFWVVGGATAGGVAQDEFLTEIYRRNLGARLRWFDRVPHAAMPGLFAKVAASGGVSVVTSRDESFGMSVAESILCGCPVVAADVGAISEIYANRSALRVYPFFHIERALDLIGEALDAPVHARDVRQTWHSELAATVSPSRACASLCAIGSPGDAAGGELR